MARVYDVIVVGGGPAGYTAALYAARAGLETLVLEKLSAGGQMALTNQIDNYPGFPEGVDGFLLGENMQKGAERFGAVTEYAQVQQLYLKETPKRVETSEGTFLGKTVVYAAGANARQLGMEKEKEWIGKGIHYCAACDGMFYRGKTVAVVGGGNSAAADALTLSRICQKVILIHRRDTLRASKVYRDALENGPNVEILWNSRVVAPEHGEKLTGVVVEHAQTGEKSMVACDGLFISIGRKPATELVKGQLELDAAGYILAGESTETNIPGVFAAGDVRAKLLRQIITAAADGAMAADRAEHYLLSQ